MEFANIFEPKTTESVFERLDKLTPDTSPQWGKMNASQMLAHLSEPYELAKKNEYKKPNALKRFFLNRFIKPIVVGKKPYSKNSPTAPQFKITDERDFQKELARLKSNINDVVKKGADHFEGWNSESFGPLTSKEWSNLFQKHLEHHLNQFGV